MYAQNGKEPVVLTDRALDWVIWKIRQSASDESGMIRRILLADDIIIHGRTLSRIKGRIKDVFREMKIEDYKIDIVTFAANTEELLIDKEEICNLQTPQERFLELKFTSVSQRDRRNINYVKAIEFMSFQIKANTYWCRWCPCRR